MKHISLFSGIGGFDLAATWAGWDNIVSCEINPFCNKVLKYYWPNAYHHNDIKTLTYEKINENLSAGWDGPNIVISGGFPCQPYSFAGKRKGKDDDRHLWPEMLRVIRELQPRWVVGENVFGLVNWDGGLVFEEVQADLEAEGYEVQPYVLPACGVNAPHRRDRIWFVAHSKGYKHNRNSGEFSSQDEQGRQEGQGQWLRKSGDANQGYAINSNNARGSARLGEVQGANGKVSQRDDNAEFGDTGAVNASNAESRRCERRMYEERYTLAKQPVISQNAWPIGRSWQDFPTQPPVCGGDDGLSAELDGITFSKWRNESIKAYGNAVVPQVVYQIFKTINKMQCNYKPHNNN